MTLWYSIVSQLLILKNNTATYSTNKSATMQPATLANQSAMLLNKQPRPTQHDVLCGRGDSYFQHPANIFLRELMKTSLDRYTAAATKVEKSCVIGDIIATVKSRNDGTAKFLRFDKSTKAWYDIGDEATRQKIGQTVREIISNNDPEKRAKRALKRSKSYEARKARISNNNKQQQQLQPVPAPFKACFRTLKVSSSSNNLSRPAPPNRSQSVPLIQGDGMVERSTFPRRRTSDSVSLADLFHAALLPPPSLEPAASSEWFDAESEGPLSECGSDFSTVFDDDDDLRFSAHGYSS
jgi:hypothetical protein